MAKLEAQIRNVPKGAWKVLEHNFVLCMLQDLREDQWTVVKEK
jgi:hypothetical protein